GGTLPRRKPRQTEFVTTVARRLRQLDAENAASFGQFPGCQRPEGLLASPTCDGPEAIRRVRGDYRRRLAIQALRRQALVFLAVVATALTAVAAANADPIASKQAQAQQVLAQLRQLDASAQRANNAYQAASARLHQIERGLRINRQALGVARINLHRAQAALSQRLVAIYTTRDEQSTLAVFLGAHSLTDLVNRIETIKSVSNQDTAVIDQVVRFQRQIVRHRAYLRHAHRLQAHLVAVRAAAKRRIDAQVAREQRLYDSVKS